MDKTIREHDGVVLLRDLPDSDLVAGETGVVVYVYENAKAYEVQFPNSTGTPRYTVTTVDAADLLKLHPRSQSRRAVS